MNGHTHRNALAASLLGLALALPGTAAAAEATQSQWQQVEQADAELEELDELIVEARRARQRNPQQSFNLLARLVGEFNVEGHVDPGTGGNPDGLLAAQGHVLCIGFGVAPGVLCELRIRWPAQTGPAGEPTPGSVSRLDPAVLLLGFDIGELVSEDDYTIPHILVDNKGLAEAGTGYRTGDDAVIFRSACAAQSAGCERMMRITADPDLQTVALQIEMNLEPAKAVRHDFLLRRVPGSESVVYGRRPGKTPEKP